MDKSIEPVDYCRQGSRGSAMAATATVIDFASYRRSRQAVVVQPAVALPMVPVLFVPWWFVPVVLVAGNA